MDKIYSHAVWENIEDDELTMIEQKRENFIETSMSCYQCHSSIPKDSAFCPKCGQKLYIKCPKCGKKYSAQWSYCSSCGVNKDEYLKIRQERKRIEKKKEQQDRFRLEQERIENEVKEQERMLLERERIDKITSSDEFKEVLEFMDMRLKKYRSYGYRFKEFISYIVLSVGIIIFGFSVVLVIGEVSYGYDRGSYFDRDLLISMFYLSFSIFLIIRGIIGTLIQKESFVFRNCPIKNKRSLDIFKDITDPKSPNYYGKNIDIYADKSRLEKTILQSYLDLFD